MALIQLSYLSVALNRTVPVTVILPADRVSFETMTYEQLDRREPFKTLYLLHGMLGNHTDWVSGTRIQRWAEERCLAVVMPSGENAFYISGPGPWSDYGTFIGEELVQMTRRMFPLSSRREDTFIAGLSMGGFGAVRNGIRYSETFSHVAGFSSALHLFEQGPAEQQPGFPGQKSDFLSQQPDFLSLYEAAAKSDRNPRVAWENLKREGRPMPRFYLSCGTEDDLLPYSRIYRDLLRNDGADVTYEEKPGAAHEWDFWDEQIRKTLDWLPLDRA